MRYYIRWLFVDVFFRTRSKLRLFGAIQLAGNGKVPPTTRQVGQIKPTCTPPRPEKCVPPLASKLEVGGLAVVSGFQPTGWTMICCRATLKRWWWYIAALFYHDGFDMFWKQPPVCQVSYGLIWTSLYTVPTCQGGRVRVPVAWMNCLRLYK